MFKAKSWSILFYFLVSVTLNLMLFILRKIHSFGFYHFSLYSIYCSLKIHRDFSLTQISTTGFYTLLRCFAVSYASEIHSLKSSFSLFSIFSTLNCLAKNCFEKAKTSSKLSFFLARENELDWLIWTLQRNKTEWTETRLHFVRKKTVFDSQFLLIFSVFSSVFSQFSFCFCFVYHAGTFFCLRPFLEKTIAEFFNDLRV